MLCPVCLKYGTTIMLDSATYTDYEGPVTCRCGAQMRVKIGRFEYQSGTPPFVQTAFQPRLVWIKPLIDAELLEGLTAPPIPQQIYDDYEAALYCFSTGVPPRAVAWACRYTIQDALLLKGIPEDRPRRMVDIAAAKNLLSEVAVKQAQAGVWLGGKGSHPQSIEAPQITQDDARQAVLFTKRVLRELFMTSGQ